MVLEAANTGTQIPTRVIEIDRRARSRDLQTCQREFIDSFLFKGLSG